jgi:ribosomal protein S2
MLINLQKTLVAINNAYYKIQDTAKDGGIILFVNTKSDISNNFLINRVSRVGASYVNHR